MINTISNLQLYNKESASNNCTKFTFSFTKHSDPLVGGYYLYKSTDNVTFTMCKFRVDDRITNTEDDVTYTIGNVTYFEYKNTISDIGAQLYFYIIVISKIAELSIASSTVQAWALLSSVSNVVASFNSKTVTITWDPITISGNINEAFTHYKIVKRKCNEVVDPVIFDEFIFDSGFSIGKYGVVKDIFATSTWFSKIVDVGKMPVVSTNLLSNVSDTSIDYAPKAHNLKAYIEDSIDIEVGTTTNTSYIDTSPEYNSLYVYSVYACGSNNTDSIKIGYPVTITPLNELVPIIRNAANMTNTFIRSKHWSKLKDTLVGDVYYNKDPYALPYFVNEPYNFVGYLGVSNCTISIYVNDFLTKTTVTDKYGVFNVSLRLPVGPTNFYVTATNNSNDISSQKSNLVEVSTYNIYTFFGVLGEEFDKLDAIQEEILEANDIDTCSYSMFELKYAPLIDLYKGMTEDEAIFKELAKCIFTAFQHVSFEQGLTELFDGFVSYIDNIDDYSIYYNHQLYRSKKTGYSFVSNINSTVTRSKHYYGLSAVGNLGQETTPTIIKVDTRYWPYGSTNQLFFMWDEVPNAVSYNIYKGVTASNLYYLTNTTHNFMLDNGMLNVDINRIPKPYNFSGITKPNNFINFIDLKVCERNFGFRKGTWIHIIIYMKDNEVLSNFQQERIIFYVDKLVPPELRYRIIVCNNSTSTILV